jgi:two-component system, NarL family, response regulator LiaR
MMNTKPIRIILVDDHRVVHQALVEMIGFVSDFELVAQGSNGQEAIHLCGEFLPDVVLMDVMMPGMDGIEATRRILAENPSIKILALSSFQDDLSVNSMLRSGAVGYVLKNTSVDELEHIIRTVYEGNAVINTTLLRKVLQPDVSAVSDDIRLTAREIEILKLIAGGMSYNQVADCLTITLSTVKFHIRNVLQKLHVETRNQAILVAAKMGIL